MIFDLHLIKNIKTTKLWMFCPHCFDAPCRSSSAIAAKVIIYHQSLKSKIDSNTWKKKNTRSVNRDQNE